MENLNYWLWLQHVIGYGKNTRDILAKFASVVEIFQSDVATLKKAGFVTAAIKRIKDKQPSDFDEVIDFCRKHSLKILTPDSEHYPKKLLDIQNYPLALFVRGDYTCLNGDNIAVIGSRTPCGYGEAAAKEIVRVLSENNTTVVSGGALGIDSISHITAMENAGKTVLVLGHGHGTVYLPENSDLRKKVTKHGAVISEYPPFTPVLHNSFPDRNRIISGICEGVVIVEAAKNSGTFSTAKHARNQGRKLFVVPGDITSGRFDGSNQLINEGAIPVFSAADILSKIDGKAFRYTVTGNRGTDSFNGLDVDASSSKKRKATKKKSEVAPVEENHEKKKNIPRKMPEGISKNAQIVYNIMSDGVVFLDEITRSSGLEIRKVLVALTELEMMGIASNTGPNQYELNNE